VLLMISAFLKELPASTHVLPALAGSAEMPTSSLAFWVLSNFGWTIMDISIAGAADL
jgi:hypothetical protein